MRSLTVVVLLATLTYVFAGCASPVATAEKRTNTDCAWYNANSCCTQDEANAVVSGTSDCTVETKCKELVNLLTCGIVCSPDISQAADSNGALRICSKFADHLYSSCKSSQSKDSTGTCKTIGDQYSSSQTFAEALGMVYDTSDSAPTCFNAAGIAQPAIFLTIAALLALVFRF